jgi:isocitrate lyase
VVTRESINVPGTTTQAVWHMGGALNFGVHGKLYLGIGEHQLGLCPFAEAVLKEHPGKALTYNCSPSFNWKKNLSDADIARFQSEPGKMGYKFQFVTLAGFHSLNAGMFELAKAYKAEGMSAYSRLQQKEFTMEAEGYTATKHQTFVGAGWFDQVQLTVSGGDASTTAVKGSTEEAQFKK